MKDGLYVNFFALKGNIEYPLAEMSMQEFIAILTNSLMDGIEKAVQKAVQKAEEE